ncbi:bifunctional 2-polyprenyl-6-hydroxyphenol methylase/3-demethylubiquinol 3-O-methyltransferase UbiG [Lewinella sp. W8]|uniref:class I SAM-dependent methyltransferase n=1 Tax=Lewinella sp. W8 TaxID=2528208 RepID=UPI0010679668|nr:class I SAM-dependent methyltransferase [Lewinella sp. W8]MTB52073.1 methyltransferase domain-containing protein [Lewinella sp. W8]
MKKKNLVGNLIYDGNIYDGMNTQVDDIAFYRRWLPKNKDARILELCCGTGRITIPIAQAGYSVTGVDHMPSMLKKAKIKAASAGAKIKFIQADIRALDLKEQYDFIFIPFNSIHHMYENEDLFNMLKNVKDHLKEGGLFLFDCFNPSLEYIVASSKEEKEAANYTTEDGRAIVIKQTMRYEKDTQINRIKWHFYINGEFDSTQELDMRMFYPQELNTYLKWSGFDILHKFGSFEEKAFSGEFDKQIFVCR